MPVKFPVGNDVSGLIDMLIVQIQQRMKYGRIVKKGNNAIALLLTKDDLKRMFTDAMVRKPANPMMPSVDKFIEVDIKNNIVEVSVRLV